MAKTVKVRRGPADSATMFTIGTKKKGNDGNIWKIGVNKNGVKRWIKLSKTKKRHRKTTFTKSLYDVYHKFDGGDTAIVLYNTGKISSFKVPNTQKERNEKYAELKKDKNDKKDKKNKKIKAIFTGMLDEHLYDTFYLSIAEPNSDGVWVDWKIFTRWFNRLPTEKKWMAA